MSESMASQSDSNAGLQCGVSGALPNASAIAHMAALERKIQWLSAWTIHHANQIRDSRDGLKVGGHQASCASMTAIMTALYFSVLRPEDRVAVKPHASPVFHAIQYLLGNQSRDQLERFRALGGAQSYPSRTKDDDDVDISTGSVGLGVAMTAFVSLVQDYLSGRGWLDNDRTGRMIALLGDAELDEGNIYEAMLEGAKQGLRNTWWIVDFNRQSLDAVTADRMDLRFARIFEATDWTVHILRFGKKLEAAFDRPGGKALKEWLESCPNDLYSALVFKGGKAWRDRLKADIGRRQGVKDLLESYDDDALADLMTNLAGHDLETLLEAFHGVDDDAPQCFIIYTIKGYGLPFQGHKDNHAGIMNPPQIEALRERMGVAEGAEWDRFAGIGQDRAELEAFLAAVPFAAGNIRRYEAKPVDVPPAGDFPASTGAEQSTQVAFGKILNALGRGDSALSERIVTTSPDVTVSTNLGGWVNQRGLFHTSSLADRFKEEQVLSPQKWERGPGGQHIELGIAESNLFTLLAALGLSHSLFGERLLPIGTLYDPFINRGLDALNYACYQDARFMLVATPSGITLGPEGGAHQSIHPPVIGMAQDKLLSFEPAFADELGEIMRWGFGYMQRPDGAAIYLRLSTRSIPQPDRSLSQDLCAAITAGGYWLREPDPGAGLAIAYTGAVAPEATAAFDQIIDEVPGAGLLAITSADRLHKGWMSAQRARAHGREQRAHVTDLLAPLSPEAGLVTVVDAAPQTLSWLGSVRGHRLASLGVDRFGQSGDIPDLYREYRLDADAILDACATVLLGPSVLPGR